MNCSYALSEQEVVKAMRLHGKGSREKLVLLALAGLLLAATVYSAGHEILSISGCIGGLVGYYCFLFLVIPLNAKKQFKQNRSIRNEITMLVDEHGISFKSESGESRLQWSDIHKWKFTPGIFILYITDNMFHTVPAKALPNERLFSESLAKCIGPAEV